MVSGCLALPRDHLDPGVLQLVGVLELVDQDVAEAPLVVLADRIVVAQQLVAAQHQLAEVHHAFALALVFVELVDLDLACGFPRRAPRPCWGAGRPPCSPMNHWSAWAESARRRC
jgi:hypothetical protein